MRPSSSHLTTASSSLACSTVPNSPVGFPKLPNPSTRSPGLSSWSVAGGSASGGFLARSESGVAPGCDRGGWGDLSEVVGDTLILGRDLGPGALDRNRQIIDSTQKLHCANLLKKCQARSLPQEVASAWA